MNSTNPWSVALGLEVSTGLRGYFSLALALALAAAAPSGRRAARASLKAVDERRV
jgi:hypothetical protein